MFENVIVAIDGRPTGRDALALARTLVAPETKISLAHVYELTPVRGASGAYGPQETAESLALLEAEREAAAVDAELLMITASSVGRGLHYLAGEHGADLLAVGSNPLSFVGRVVLGDTTRASLIRRSLRGRRRTARLCARRAIDLRGWRRLRRLEREPGRTRLRARDRDASRRIAARVDGRRAVELPGVHALRGLRALGVRARRDGSRGSSPRSTG